jgi:hypothetical protein
VCTTTAQGKALVEVAREANLPRCNPKNSTHPMRPFFKECKIYGRPEGFYVFPVKRTVYGGFTTVPASTHSRQTTANEIGKSVMVLFSKLSGDAADDVNLPTIREPFLSYLKEVGFKTLLAFEKNATLVDVCFDGENYIVSPHEKDTRGQFVPIRQLKLPPDSTTEQIGDAVLTAFSEAR